MALPVMRSIKQGLEKIEMQCPLIFDVLALVCLFKDRVCLKAGVLACCSKRSRQCEKKKYACVFSCSFSQTNTAWLRAYMIKYLRASTLKINRFYYILENITKNTKY